VKPPLVRFAVDLQPPTAEALRNFAEASGRPVSDVMVAALDLGLARMMGDFNRQKREAAKVDAQVRWARQTATQKAAAAVWSAKVKAEEEARAAAALARVNAAIPAAARAGEVDDEWPDGFPL
jgi:hypothetical protein